MPKHTLTTGKGHATVQLRYDPERRMVTISDHGSGPPPQTITLIQLLFQLGVPLDHCREAIEGSHIAFCRCASCDHSAWCYFDHEAMVCIDYQACGQRIERDREREGRDAQG